MKKRSQHILSLKEIKLKKLIKSEIAKEIKPLQEKISELMEENLRLKIALGGM